MTKDTQINFRATEQTKRELDALVDASISTSISEYLRHLIHTEYQQIAKGENKMSSKERNTLISRFMDLHVGDMDAFEISVETHQGLEKLEAIVSKYYSEHDYWYVYYEDNGGGLHLFVMDEDKVVAGITNLEYAQPNEWNMVKDGLAENPLDEIAGWDGCMEDEDIDPEEFYDQISGDRKNFVCWNGKLYPERMGRAAQKYFGINAED